MSVIEEIVADVCGEFGAGSAMVLSQKPKKIPVIPSGVPQVDIALGVGGIPKGRIVEIYGPESSGKTTLALHILAQAQKHGIAAFVDAEHALDRVYAKALGVDIDNIILSQPDSGEKALQITESFVRTGECSIVVVDSVASLVPEAELRGEIGDAHIGLQARLMGQALRMLTPVVAKTKTILIFINQIRMKIGVMFGSPETTPGGRALKFYASVRIDIRRIGGEKEGSGDKERNVGNKTKITIRKNKVAPPFKVVEATLIFGKGFDPTHNFFPAALAVGFMKKKGNTFSINGEKIAVGKKKTIVALQENYDINKLLGDMNIFVQNKDIEVRIEKLEVKLEDLEKGSDEYKKVRKRIKKLKKKIGGSDEQD